MRFCYNRIFKKRNTNRKKKAKIKLKDFEFIYCKNYIPVIY